MASDLTCSTIDRTRWNVTLNWVGTDYCPYACPVQPGGAYQYACSGTTPQNSGIGVYGVGTCKTFPSFITPSLVGASTTRAASIVAFSGALLNVQNFWRSAGWASATGSNRFGAMNGVPVLSPTMTIPTTLNTRINFHVVDFGA